MKTEQWLALDSAKKKKGFSSFRFRIELPSHLPNIQILIWSLSCLNQLKTSFLDIHHSGMLNARQYQSLPFKDSVYLPFPMSGSASLQRTAACILLWQCYS